MGFDSNYCEHDIDGSTCPYCKDEQISILEDRKSLYDVITNTCFHVDGEEYFNCNRDEAAVLFHLVEEVGEVALEISIENGTSYKKASEDGVVGEAIDVIINALDLIHVHSPSLTEKDLIAIAMRKCDKWKSKVVGIDLA